MQGQLKGRARAQGTHTTSPRRCPALNHEPIQPGKTDDGPTTAVSRHSLGLFTDEPLEEPRTSLPTPALRPSLSLGPPPTCDTLEGGASPLPPVITIRLVVFKLAPAESFQEASRQDLINAEVRQGGGSELEGVIY